jgi:D-proline reductase (dithiol) PrdB
MSQLSRRCVPFTPFEGELSRASVAIVSSGGVHRRDQEPFNIADDLGDLTFRVIGGETAPGDLMVTHHHYDHTDADRDINVVFPIEPLRDLARDGVIGAVAAEHIGFMGYTTQLRRMYEETAPQIAERIDREARADVVVLTGG